MASKRKHSRRNSLRFRFHNFDVRYMASGVLGRGKLQNISTGGCFISHISDPVKNGEDVLVAVEFETLERPLEFKGSVLRTEGDSFSAAFTEIDTPEDINLTTLLAQAARESFRQADNGDITQDDEKPAA